MNSTAAPANAGNAKPHSTTKPHSTASKMRPRRLEAKTGPILFSNGAKTTEKITLNRASHKHRSYQHQCP